MVLAIISGSGFLIRHEALSNMREEVDEALEDIADGEWDEIDYYEDGIFLQAFDRDGNLIGGRDYEDFPPLGQDHGRMVEDGRWFVYSQEGRGGVVVRALMPASEVGTYMSSVQLMALVFLPLILFLSALGGYFIVRRSFRPADRAVEAVGQIVTSNDLSKRIGLGDGDDEIHSMTKAFDAMLDRLEEAFRKEKQFTSDASHELRTPVSVILAQCDAMLDNEELTEEQKIQISLIRRKAKGMADMISQLLFLSRADQGRQPLNREWIDLSELTEMAAEEQQMLADADGRGIHIETQICPEIWADVDETFYIRMLVNLISNALRYSRENGLVEVSLEQDGGVITGSVRDYGQGIAPDVQPHIWERFYQAEASRTDGSHAGLGLSMVKWIAEAHGGSVSVESEEGQGSTFSFCIPAGENNF